MSKAFSKDNIGDRTPTPKVNKKCNPYDSMPNTKKDNKPVIEKGYTGKNQNV